MMLQLKEQFCLLVKFLVWLVAVIVLVMLGLVLFGQTILFCLVCWIKFNVSPRRYPFYELVGLAIIRVYNENNKSFFVFFVTAVNCIIMHV